MSSPLLIPALSLLLQVLAATIALRWMRLTSARLAWGLITGALICMAVRRGYTLLEYLQGEPFSRFALINELFSLAIALFLSVGVYALGAVFHAAQVNAHALRQHKEELETLLDAIPAIVVYKDRDSRTLRANKAFADAHQLAIANVIGKSTYDLFPPDEAAARIRDDQAVMASGQPLRAIVESYRTPTGMRWAQTDKVPLHGEDGQTIGIVGVALDITELKAAEVRLHRLNRALTLLSTCNRALVRATREDDLLQEICRLIVEHGDFRVAWVALIESAGDETAGQSIRVGAAAGLSADELATWVTRWADLEARVGPVAQALHTHRPAVLPAVLTGDVPLSCREAARVCGYAAACALPLRIGEETIGALAIYAATTEAFQDEDLELFTELADDMSYGLHTLRTRHDRDRVREELQALNASLETRISERTRELESTNADLARSNAELQQFAYIASHDLQEPLRMVVSYLQLLERRYKAHLDADAQDFIWYAVDGATRMKRLINDLLTYSRAGSRGITVSELALEEVFRQVEANLATALAEAGAVVTHDPLPLVWASETQLVQVLQNLVANAVKFRGESPPQVHIGACHTLEGWQLSVSDNGIGFDMAHAEKIFGIFQRLHTREEYPGTGIGLAVCKRIIERIGGRIWVESHPGHGTTFFFTIPHTEAFSHDSPNIESSTGTPAGRG
jgi:PAS domain S-box-containing protein